MGQYLFKRQTAARAAETPCPLAPPLREAWQTSRKSVVFDLPLVAEGRLFFGDKGRLRAVDERQIRHPMWTLDRAAEPSLVRDGMLLIWLDQTAHLLGAADGKTIRSSPLPVSLEVAAVADTLLGFDGRQTVFGARLPELELIWRFDAPCRISSVFCANSGAVFFGLEDGSVRALSLDDGREVWSRRLKETDTEGALSGFCGLYGDLLLCRRTGRGVVALNAASGEDVWHAAVPDVIQDSYLYGDHYYLVTHSGHYEALETRTGKATVKADLRKGLPPALARFSDFYPLLISQTHAWVGVGPGYVVAFERDSGKYAWHHHPKGAGSFQRQTYFVSVNGRFYYTDMSLRMYCLEQVQPGETAPTSGEAGAAAHRKTAAQGS